MQIISNGSKWAGEALDSIQQLLDVLAHYTLDPSFEEFGPFVSWTFGGTVCVFGNFLDISHVFRIEGTLEEIRPIAIAIRMNRRSESYKRAYIAQFGSGLEFMRRCRRMRKHEACRRNRTSGASNNRSL